MKQQDQKTLVEFQTFLSANEIPPPAVLSESLRARVTRDLNPSNQQVFLKMLGIHSLVSLFTLSICSQFGLQTLPLYDAMESMMSLVGPTYCMAFCGLIYLSLSALAFSFFLRPEEVQVIRRNLFLQFALLSGISLGVFLCFGAQILLLPGSLWFVGSLVGGLASLEIGWQVRTKFRKQILFGI